MFSQTNAQSNVNTSLFTVTTASIGSAQRTQPFNPAKNAKFGAVPIKPTVRMSAMIKDASEPVKMAQTQRNGVRMSANNQDGAEQVSQNKFMQTMQQVASNITNKIDMALQPQQPFLQLAGAGAQFPVDSNLSQNFMKFNQVKSMAPGFKMNQNGVAQSQFTVSQKPAPRSSVQMNASTAISGNGSFEGLPYNENDKWGWRAYKTHMSQFTVTRSSASDINMMATEYAQDLDSFLADKPHGHAVVDNIDEKGSVPNNTFKPKDPYVGKVIFNETLTGPDAGEVCHIAFDHEGNLPYAEGQSIGIVAKGNDANGKPHKLRLYSIASSAPGDYGDGKTVSLCVKRLIYEDDEGKEVKGVCSNYICDLKPGDEVMITGPVGKALLLPKDEKANVIMLATGTGIAPFRSFLWRFFMENHPDYKFDGEAWLFLGVPTTTALLYDNEFKKMKEIGGDKFRYDYAISREQTNEAGDKMYIQTRMAEYGEELWDKMQLPNTYVYMCGLKGMESGIQEALGGFAEKNGTDWKDFVKKMKKEGRYHVEVY